MIDISIINATVVNEGLVEEADLYIKNGRIEKISSGLDPQGEVIDASDLFLFPGVIDDQVHFREPGLTHKGNIQSESMAAVAGGTTSYMDMPNVLPPTLTQDLWEKKNNIASINSYANYSFYMGTSNDNIEVIKALNPNKVCGVKIFMGSSTGNLLVDNEKSLENIFKESPVIITTHCEDSNIIQENEKKFIDTYGEDLPFSYHTEIRNRESCIKSTTYAINLAKRFNSQLHVLHISTKDELDFFKSGPVDKKNITAEVCIPHLFFSSKDYESQGPLIKCNPSIKHTSDQLALIEALKEERIDFVATDHAPHTMEEKQQIYKLCPAGMPSIQFTLLVVIDLVEKNVLSLEEVPKITAHNVASRFKIKERGFIREGYWADLVLVDRKKKYTVTDNNILSKCRWSPFKGNTFSSTIIETIINGKRVYSKGKILTENIAKELEFERG